MQRSTQQKKRRGVSAVLRCSRETIPSKTRVLRSHLRHFISKTFTNSTLLCTQAAEVLYAATLLSFRRVPLTLSAISLLRKSSSPSLSPQIHLWRPAGHAVYVHPNREDRETCTCHLANLHRNHLLRSCSSCPLQRNSSYISVHVSPMYIYRNASFGESDLASFFPSFLHFLFNGLEGKERL